jgi:hypothetical protein
MTAQTEVLLGFAALLLINKCVVYAEPDSQRMSDLVTAVLFCFHTHE